MNNKLIQRESDAKENKNLSIWVAEVLLSITI